MAAACREARRASFAVEVRDLDRASGDALAMSGGESGAFHLHGYSSKGKTTVAQAGASCWGKGSLKEGFIKSWKATINGLESSFASASDTCLILDELAQLAHGEAAPVIYTLTGEIGKQRLRADSTARTPYTWRTIALSTGEAPLFARIDEDRLKWGKKGPRGGTLVRAIDIPIDRANGAFDQVEGDPADFANQMKQEASTYYGVAGPAFVKALIDKRISAETVRQNVEKFVKDVLADVRGDKGQVGRVAARFGLVAVAGVLACAFGLVDWDAEALVKDIKGMFRNWLKSRGATGPIEERHMIAQVRAFMEPYGESRFNDITTADPDRKPVFERAGFRRGRDNDRRWFILSEEWKKICEGFDPTSVAKVLLKHGVLESGNEPGRYTKVERILGRPQRFYVLNPKIYDVE
jgi:uncharacterized protein (DUF927 family)